MNCVQFKSIFPAEVCEVQGKPYLFTNLRVARDSLPKHFEAYDVRDNCGDGRFWEIQRIVQVDHWGTIIGLEPIELDEHGQYKCPPESSEGTFLGFTMQDESEFVVWRGALNAYARAVSEVQP